MKFGEKVRDLRKKHSLTQDELAKCLGVSKRTVIGWERDGRYPRNVEILEKMADIFHVPLTYIQPDQSLFIERAAATYGKKGKIEAQHLALLNSTPFVRQYDILFNKWGVLLCQKEYQTNDIRRNSREWL